MAEMRNQNREYEMAIRRLEMGEEDGRSLLAAYFN